MTTWSSAAFFTTCAWWWSSSSRSNINNNSRSSSRSSRRISSRRWNLNALDSLTSFAVYFFLDLFRTATQHSDCHCVFLLVICLVLDFYCSLINIINPQNLVTSFGNKNNSNLALFLKIK